MSISIIPYFPDRGEFPLAETNPSLNVNGVVCAHCGAPLFYYFWNPIDDEIEHGLIRAHKCGRCGGPIFKRPV
jgi:hypothetical protein